MNVEAIKEIGVFYKDFFLYYEETEWCNRALKNNWKVKTNTNAVAYHTSSEKSKKYHYYLTKNRLVFAKIDNLNYSSVKMIMLKQIVFELTYSVLKLKKPRRYFISRLKGILKGINQNITNYHESISTF